MLETCVNQGVGLQGIGLHAAPRVIAMASHGSQEGELPLLWSLCSTLVDFGYPVAVLDATTTESPDNPGLAQLLDHGGWHGEDHDSLRSCSVIPAALGLQRLCTQNPAQGALLDPLGGLLQNFGVIVIYACADVLTLLLPGTGIEPLLTVSSLKTSPVSAYRALKQMLLNAKLRPTMASIVSEPFLNASMTESTPIKNLQECAMTFLGYRLDSLAVHTQQPGERRSDDMSRLALRLLENAMPLHRNQYVGSH